MNNRQVTLYRLSLTLLKYNLDLKYNNDRTYTLYNIKNLQVIHGNLTFKELKDFTFIIERLAKNE